MVYAQLMNRGEQFFVVDGSSRFEGECVWSRREVPGEHSTPVYPLRLFVKSIRRAGLLGLMPLTTKRRLELAYLAKQLIEAREPGSTVEVLENY